VRRAAAHECARAFSFYPARKGLSRPFNLRRIRCRNMQADRKILEHGSLIDPMQKREEERRASPWQINNDRQRLRILCSFSCLTRECVLHHEKSCVVRSRHHETRPLWSRETDETGGAIAETVRITFCFRNAECVPGRHDAGKSKMLRAASNAAALSAKSDWTSTRPAAKAFL
jgi:hypothetical protein